MKSEATHEAGEGTRARLSQFGKLLKAAREKTIPSQQEAARRLTEAGYPVSQSLIAQLETGRISNPDASMLRKLSEVYGVPYAELVRDLVLDKYGVSGEGTSQFYELLDSGAAVPADEIQLKAHLIRSKLEFFKHANVLDVEGMAEWQQTFPELKNYWVIAPDFVDDKNEKIRDSVIYNLERNVNITYFVTTGETLPGGKFFMYQERLKEFSQKAAKINAVEVSPDNLRWLVADVVVANPVSSKQVGYLVVRSDGKPAFGLRMSTEDLAKTIKLIAPYATNQNRKALSPVAVMKKRA